MKLNASSLDATKMLRERDVEIIEVTFAMNQYRARKVIETIEGVVVQFMPQRMRERDSLLRSNWKTARTQVVDERHKHAIYALGDASLSASGMLRPVAT